MSLPLWDDLDRAGPEPSARSELAPWRIIGFDMLLADVDDLNSSTPRVEGLYSATVSQRPRGEPLRSFMDASFMGDA